MDDAVIDDTPGQGYLFDAYRKNKEVKETKRGSSDDWLDEAIGHDHLGKAKVFTCNPATCTDDCNKCRIFGKT